MSRTGLVPVLSRCEIGTMPSATNKHRLFTTPFMRRTPDRRRLPASLSQMGLLP
jgi:hypothetical protein